MDNEYSELYRKKVLHDFRSTKLTLILASRSSCLARAGSILKPHDCTKSKKVCRIQDHRCISVYLSANVVGILKQEACKASGHSEAHASLVFTLTSESPCRLKH